MQLYLILIPVLAALLGGACSSGIRRTGKDPLQAATDSDRTFYRISLGACILEMVLSLAAAVATVVFSCSPEAFAKALSGDLLPEVRLPFCGTQILLCYDGFRLVYTLVLSFMWLMSMLFSADYFRGHGKLSRYYFCQLLTLGAIMGVFLAGDLMTALIFFEIMSFASFPWVIQEETEGALRAANTYLAVAVIGGLSALMGLFLLQNELGTLELSALYHAAEACPDRTVLYVAGGCILAGFGAKAGMFPLHIWLPKAHPVAPAPASALLSGALTKSGIWGIIAITVNIFRYDASWGMAVLLLGTVTMVLGAVLAVFSIDLKRTLACSSMSQIGFILIGIGLMPMLGEENTLAARGALLHMVNHSAFKLVLFLAAGCIYMNAHALDLNKIRGFGRDKKFLMVCFLFGALGISGIPGLNGYISKTLLHEAIVEASSLYGSGLSAYAQYGTSAPGAFAQYGTVLKAVEWIFLFSGGLTLAYMTKLSVCIFVEKAEEKPAAAKASGKASDRAFCKDGCVAKKLFLGNGAAISNGSYMSAAGFIALGLAALVIPVLGVTARTSMNRIADLGSSFFAAALPEEAVRYYSPENLKGSMISIAIGILVYFAFIRRVLIRNGRYVDLWPAKLDLEDLIYRPLLLDFLPAVFGKTAEVFAENKVTGALARGMFRTGMVISHALCDLLDAVLLGLRKTVFRPSPLPITDSVYHSFPYQAGALVDRIRVRRKLEKEGNHEYAQLFVRSWRTAEISTHNLLDSISAALLLLCLTICGALVYVFFLR